MGCSSRIKRLFPVVVASVVTGCASGSGAILQTLQAGVRRDAPADVRLNPAFQYLRVTVNRRPAFLALGYVEDQSGSRTEVWYSAEREVLRLQHGRVAGVTGAAAEWRNVVMPQLPTWSELARSDGVYRWERVRDVMPGYRYGVSDRMSLRRIASPSQSGLQRRVAQDLTWFEEASETAPVLGMAADEVRLPPARYAVDLAAGDTVVYGEQCLTRDFCFTWQRWPIELQGAVQPR